MLLRNILTASDTTRRSSLGRMVSESTVLLMVSIGALILVLALLILFHQNSNATKGYLLRNLERERSQFLLEQEVLNMQVARAQAMEKIEQERQIESMIPVKSPKYVLPETEPSQEFPESDTSN